MHEKKSYPGLPVCVDLDGTLIRGDVLQIRLRRIIRTAPWLLAVACWKLLRGRACLKQWITRRIPLDPASLAYNTRLLGDLRVWHRQGCPLYLATAADTADAEAVSGYLGIFTGCFASDGKTNLRAEAKGRCLAARFGIGGFIYAGNSKDDLKVWKYAGEAIAVDTPSAVMNTLSRLQGVKVRSIYP